MTDKNYAEVIDEASRRIGGAVGVLRCMEVMADGSSLNPDELGFVADGLKHIQELLDGCSDEEEAEDSPKLVG